MVGNFHLKGDWLLEHQTKLRSWLKTHCKVNVYRYLDDPDTTGPGFHALGRKGFEFTVKSVMSGRLELFYYQGSFDDINLSNILS